GLLGLVILLSPDIGPTFFGVLVFYFLGGGALIVLVVGGVIGYIVGFKFMHNFSTPKFVQLVKVSDILSTLGFGLMLYAFSIAGTMGFHHPIVIISFSLSLLIIFWFIKRQLSIDHPILRLEAFNNRPFSLPSIPSMIEF
ncbi:MFS transporter, partial [Staphylococcus hyicus]